VDVQHLHRAQQVRVVRGVEQDLVQGRIGVPCRDGVARLRGGPQARVGGVQGAEVIGAEPRRGRLGRDAVQRPSGGYRSSMSLPAASGSHGRVHSNVMVGLVDDLKQRGLLERREDPADRRARKSSRSQASRRRTGDADGGSAPSRTGPHGGHALSP
jgi:hypothetical protein